MSHARAFSRFAVHACAVAGIVACAVPSHAYRMMQNTSTGRIGSYTPVTCDAPGGFMHWSQPNISWYHNTSGQGAGKASALQTAMNSWTAVNNALHTLTYAGTTTAGFVTDGRNTLVWGTNAGCTSTCLALTALVLQPGQVIVESDVIFNAGYSWQTNGSDYDVQAAAAHELGHSLGIGHTNVTSSPLPTMYAGYFGTDQRSLAGDDWGALQCAQNRYFGPIGTCSPAGSLCTTGATCCSGYCSMLGGGIGACFGN